MTATPRGSTRSAAIARAIYRRALRWHPSAREGYASQMTATFDALVDSAAERGAAAVAGLLMRELAGLRSMPGDSLPLDAGVAHRRRKPFIANVVQDIRYALRTFRRRPGFTAALVATLGLGIGANTAIFSVVNAVLLQRLPFPESDRLVMVWEDMSTIGFPRNTPAAGNYTDWTTTIEAFDKVAALDQRDFNFAGDGEPEKIGGAGVTANLFSTLGVAPLLGRVWRAEEDVPGNRLAVLSYTLWQRRFGGDAGVVGRSVIFNDAPYTVLGVMPPRFEVLGPELEMWVPIGFTTAERQDRGSHYLSVLARLGASATLAQANVQLHALAMRLQQEHPETNRALGMYAVPLLDDYVGDTRAVLFVLLGAVGCVLLIACANVANLLLTRAAGRSGEMAVRAALGADRGRLIRQLMTESVLLAAAGGSVGVVVAKWSFGTLTNLVPQPLTAMRVVSLDARVLIGTAVVSAMTGILFGLAPAWRASRVDLAGAAVRQGSRRLVSGPSRLGRTLVVAEVALATVLLIGAGLLTQSFRSAKNVNLGFRPEHVLTLRLQLPRRTYADFDKRVQFVDAVLARVRAVSGVTSAGYTSAVPLVWKGGTSGFKPEGAPRDPLLPYDANNRVVSADYMETMGMTLRAGRFFDVHDDATGMPATIINETMARQYWPGQDPVGRRMRAGSEGGAAPWRTIVGVIDDTCPMGLDQPSRAEMFFPIAQSRDNWMWPRDLVIRATGDPSTLTPDVRRAVWSVDRSQPLSNIVPMSSIVDDELRGRRVQMTLMTAFAGLALVLAAIGVYGVLSYNVSARTSEIGLRLALGGDPRRIRTLVIGQGLALVGAGLAIGLGAAFWGATLLGHLLFRVPPHDLGTFAGQTGLLAIVCLVAAYLPAVRASRVDPVTALRAE